MIHWQPTGPRRDLGAGGRLIVRYGWNGYVPPPSPPSLLCVGIEWMSRGGEIRAGRPRAHARIYRFDSSDHRSIPLSTTGKSTQTTKSEVAPTWERASPFRDDRSLTADLSMVESHFYADATIACRARALYPISVAHVRMNMRTKERRKGRESVC